MLLMCENFDKIQMGRGNTKAARKAPVMLLGGYIVASSPGPGQKLGRGLFRKGSGHKTSSSIANQLHS